MDSIEKFLRKITKKERREIKDAIEKIIKGKTESLDLVKLKGGKGMYRVRVRNFRIIYKVKNKKIYLLFIGKRDEKTYKNI